MLTGARLDSRLGAGLEVLALGAAAGVWAWWLGPQQQHVLAWVLLPGWAVRLDGLSLVFLTLFLAVPAPVPGPSLGSAPVQGGSPVLQGRGTRGVQGGSPVLQTGGTRGVQGGSPVLQTGGAGAVSGGSPDPAPRGPARRARLPGIGWGVCRTGLALTALAGTTAGQILGLGLAAAGLAVAAWPLGPARALAPALLLPVALSGAFDLLPAPGRPVPLLPWPLVGLALAAAAGGTGAWPFAGGRAAVQAPPPGAARGAWMAALYGAGSLLPLLRSLGAGAWDPWTRLAVLAVGLLTLAAAACAALAAVDLPAAMRAGRDYLVGALLVGLGLGTPEAVGGGLVLFVAGLAGLGLASGGRPAQAIGTGAIAGLPPTLGFAGLWLLLGAAASAPAPLALAALPAAGLLAALAGARLAPAPGRGRVAAALVAGSLVIGGLVPGPLLDGALRPALSPLAAGLPALGALQPWPGVGLILAAGPRTVAVWPAWGLLATLVLALAGAEAFAHLLGLARRLRRHPGGTETRRFWGWVPFTALPGPVEGASADRSVRDAAAGSDDTGEGRANAGPLVAAAAHWALWIDPASVIQAGAARLLGGRRGP